jgi:predicted PurR-regulated permease PerM
LDPRLRKLVLFTLIIIGVILFLLFLHQIKGIIMPFFMAALLAYILLPPVEFLVKHKVPMTYAIISVYLACTGFIMILVLYIFPGIFSELNRFAADIPEYAQSIQKFLRDWQQTYTRFNIPESIRQIIDENLLSIEEKIIDIVRSGAAFIVGLFSYTFSLIILPILTYYFRRDNRAFQLLYNKHH